MFNFNCVILPQMDVPQKYQKTQDQLLQASEQNLVHVVSTLNDTIRRMAFSSVQFIRSSSGTMDKALDMSMINLFAEYFGLLHKTFTYEKKKFIEFAKVINYNFENQRNTDENDANSMRNISNELTEIQFKLMKEDFHSLAKSKHCIFLDMARETVTMLEKVPDFKKSPVYDYFILSKASFLGFSGTERAHDRKKFIGMAKRIFKQRNPDRSKVNV
uniref:RGS domain-containing protein n=1 Tax=Rhabditophanes sp. KR3021 TaxID=114890 RepID=A0AC35TNU6_9BILA